MIKRTLILIALLLTLSVAGAQTWTVYPLYDGVMSGMVETPSKLYYSSNGSLYSYDKNTQETYAYTSANKLSDCTVTEIFYNKKHKYLLAVYENTNMDVIYDDGRVVNLPEILNANITVSKKINSVNMQDDYICIATSFGYVLYDADKLVVKESRNWGSNIYCVTVWRDMVVIEPASDMRYARLDERHTSLDDFKYLRLGSTAGKMQVIGNELFYLHRNYRNIYQIISFNADAANPAGVALLAESYTRSDWFKPSADGYYLVCDNEIKNFGDDGKALASTTLPQLFRKSQIAKWKSDTNIWHGCKDGVGNFDISADAPVVLQEYYRPEGGVCRHVAFISHSADGERVYLTSGSSMVVRTCDGTRYAGPVNSMYSYQTTDMIEQGDMYDVSYEDLSDYELHEGSFTCRGGDGMVVEDPVDNSVYYLASRFDGVRVIDRDTRSQIVRFSKKNGNAPFVGSWGNNVFALGFDRFNNLWVLNGMEPNDTDYSNVYVLPAAALRNPANVKSSDWLTHKVPSNYRNNFECMMLSCRLSNNIVLQSAGYGMGVVVIDTKGTESISDDREIQFTSFLDQDGNTFSPTTYTFVAEDHRGKVWIGSQDGIIEIDPREAFNSDFRCNRIKVPRNDGTNYADYLLAGEQINWISVDPADRKWIATQNSGLYLVSETGDKILEHYTTDNSPLPSNAVNAVEASRVDNKVYIGTNYGTIVYSSDAAPAADNMDNVYAYPNPVRPDYSGWITVCGLMENSLVKITDAQGSVLFQGRSEGGMVIWDGCNPAGERVRSGVYFVLASENGSGSNYSAVTKIMVIN